MSTITSPSTQSGPPRVPEAHAGVGEAMRRFAPLVLLLVLLLGGLGVAYGLQRSPQYTATAENVVQALSPSVAQLPGAIQASQDLASNQSRLIDSDEVVGPVAGRLGVSNAYVASRVSATAVSGSSVIRIEADGAEADDAISLANAVARSFATFVNAQTRSQLEGEETLREYREASAAYQRELAAKQGIDRAGDAASPTERLRAASAVDAAQLRREALSAQYQAVIQSGGSAPRLETFVIAREADSDRWPTVQLFGFAGVVCGLLIGAALATALANRRTRRAV